MINVFSNPYRPNGNPIPRPSKPVPVEAASDELRDVLCSWIIKNGPMLKEYQDKNASHVWLRDRLSSLSDLVRGCIESAQDAEIVELRKLTQDAVGALRYIEQTQGRLYGVGWDRVYDKAAALKVSNDDGRD